VLTEILGAAKEALLTIALETILSKAFDKSSAVLAS
jgi:hypothetical protein